MDNIKLNEEDGLDVDVMYSVNPCGGVSSDMLTSALSSRRRRGGVVGGVF